jgi:hypothetical protein
MYPTGPADPTDSRALAASRLSREATDEARRAARYAVSANPGPIGDLVDQELKRYIEAGEELHAPALPPRLIAALRASEAQHPLPPTPNWRHLPAQYIPGTPLHWRYRTAADDDR